MNISDGFAIAAGVLQLSALLFAVVATVKGQMKPSTTAFGIWSIAAASLFASSLSAGANSNLPFIGAGAVGAMTMFGLSLKYGYRKWSWLDPTCFILAVISLIVWYLTKEAAYAIYILSLIDWLALLPIVRKSWKDPTSESKTVWRISLLSSVCLVIAITDWRWAVVVVAFTQFFHSFIVTILLHLPRRKRLSHA